MEPASRLSPLEEARLKARRYNTIKMRTTLSRVDARLTWVFLAWMIAIGIVAMCYAWNPKLYPLPDFLLWSLGCVVLDCVIVNAVRRMSETFLDELCASSKDPDLCKKLTTYENETNKPYRREDDPPDVRASFAWRHRLGLSTRGIGHLTIVKMHWFILALYLVNYVKYFGHASAENLASQILLLHMVMTAGRGGMLLKNSAYLFNSRGLLEILRGVIALKAGEHTLVVEERVTDTTPPPCGPCENTPKEP